MGFATFRVGHQSKNNHKNNKNHNARLVSRDDSTSFSPKPSCFTGGFYTSPSNGATIPSMDALPITWDPSCLDTTHADIYLFSPGSTSSRIHVWQRVPFSQGTYTAQLMPRWWNSTSSQSLQLSIVSTDTPPFLTPLPAGPVFTATYSPPTDGSPPPPEADTSQSDSGITLVSPTAASESQKKSLISGRTAAAVLVPLLFIALAVLAYFKWQRRRAQKETKRFSVAVDKRMSTISGDWKSMTPAGASAAIRSSMAAGRDSAAFAFGGVRPSSVLGSGTGVVGEQMSQIRTGTGVGLRQPKPPSTTTDRVSRVSFAADTRVSRVSFADTVGRPSTDSRRTRAFHSAYIPPVPTNPNTTTALTGAGDNRRTEVMSMASAYPDSLLPVEDGHLDTDPATLSPRQAQGALTLTTDDIRSRIQTRSNDTSSPNAGNAGSDIDVMPALSMMRTNQSDEYLFTPLPTPPTPSHPKPTASHYSPANVHANVHTPTSPAPTYTTLPQAQAQPPTYGLSPTPAPGSPFGVSSPGVYAQGLVSPLTPAASAAGSVFGSQQQQQQQAPPPPQQQQETMSPDEMMRAYAERRAAAAAMGRSGSALSVSGSGGSGSLLNSGSVGGLGGLGRMEVDGPPPSFNHPHGGQGAGGAGGVGKRKMSLRGLARVVTLKSDSHTSNSNSNSGMGKKTPLKISAPVLVEGSAVPGAPSSSSTSTSTSTTYTPVYAAYATGGRGRGASSSSSGNGNTSSVYSTGPGMAGVGARAMGMAGVGMGVGVGVGVGGAYAIGEDDEDDEGYGGYGGIVN